MRSSKRTISAPSSRSSSGLRATRIQLADSSSMAAIGGSTTCAGGTIPAASEAAAAAPTAATTSHCKAHGAADLSIAARRHMASVVSMRPSGRQRGASIATTAAFENREQQVHADVPRADAESLQRRLATS
jgi:hypothetical protein